MPAPDIPGQPAGELSDPRRTEPAFVQPERAMLESWLDFHRVTLLLKCEQLDDAARKSRPVSTSRLSLHGLIRHMAEVERGWFQGVLQGDTAELAIWSDPAIQDSELLPLDDADWDADRAVWQEECNRSRAVAASRELDDTGMHRGPDSERNGGGEPCSLRWIYLHMIEEYARHNGHADLMRELIDGEVGV